MNWKLFVLKAVVNWLFWLLTFLVLGLLAPWVVRKFAPGATMLHFDFAGLADVRLMIAQLAGIGLAAAALKSLQPAAPGPGAGAGPGPGQAGVGPGGIPMPGVGALFQEEAFSAALSFGSICFCIALLIGDWSFMAGAVVNYLVAFSIR